MDHRTDYRPDDRQRWLGDPPWGPSDPAVKEWEDAHGHDPRQKCLVEYGCMAISYERDALARTVDMLLSALEKQNEASGLIPEVHALKRDINRLRGEGRL